MVNKNLLSLATLVSLSLTTFLVNTNPVQGITANSEKKLNTQTKLSKNLKVEKTQLITNLININKINQTEKSTNNIEQSNTIKPEPFQIARRVSGKASWYGPGFHGRRTANGERYNQNALTAAHRSLPFGTRVRVTNVNNGRSVVVRINDRGPFVRGRVIDVSAAAAHSLGMVHHGVVPVSLQVLR